jgi:hypothetical protein
MTAPGGRGPRRSDAARAWGRPGRRHALGFTLNYRWWPTPRLQWLYGAPCDSVG